MANTKSAKTKVRVIDRKTAINKAVRNRYRTYVKKTELDIVNGAKSEACLLYTSPSPRDATLSRMPSSA